MRRHLVLLTDCLSEPGPEIARRLADAGATVLLNSREDAPELGDLLHEIAEHGGGAIACNLDPSDKDRFEGVLAFVEPMAGPLTGIVLQSGVADTPRPLQDTRTELVRDEVATIVEDALDWCRLALPVLRGASEAALVGLWSSVSSGSILASASFAAWEKVLACTRVEAVPCGVGVHVVQTPWASCGAAERDDGLMGSQSAVDAVISRLGIPQELNDVNRPLVTAEGVAK